MKKIIGFIVFLVSFFAQSQNTWEVPNSVVVKNNPVTDKLLAVQKGKKIFQSLCVACHGVSGEGNGIAAIGLDPKPTNFTSDEFQKQPDGIVFWKISKGRGMMASYENMLSENDRWALVTYLKNISKKKEVISENKKKDQRVKNTFLFTQLINAQTIQMLPKGSGEFTIQHRFGQTAFNADFINQFLGMDLSSNIRIAYARALSENMYVEIGRTKYGKVYDFNVKYKISDQTVDNKMPIGIAVFADLAVMTDKFPNVVEGSTFANGEPFTYQFAHRLSYNFQIIFAKYFSDVFSLQLSPVFIWYNLVPLEDKNFTMAFPISGRFKINRKTALLFEVSPTVTSTNDLIPISIAYEIASSGAHAFQIVLSSTDRILESRVYTNPSYDYTKANFVLGFNIKRVF